MDDKLYKLFQSKVQGEPREEMWVLRPNADSARWVGEQWQKRVDGELLAGAMGKMGSAAANRPEPQLNLEHLKQILASVLMPVPGQDVVLGRLAERLRATRLIRFIASQSIPMKDIRGDAIWYWEECDVFLIAPDWVSFVRQQFEQTGHTMVEVDEAWWRLQAQALMRGWELRP